MDSPIRTVRQKACSSCASAKVRCDKAPTCARCRHRGLTCRYPSSDHAVQDASHVPMLTSASFSCTSETRASTAGITLASPPSLETTNAQSTRLICSIDASAIQNRWLKTFMLDSDDKPKTLPLGTAVFVRQILKSYTNMIIKNCRPPPFIHHSQIRDQSELSHCFRLLQTMAVQPVGQSHGFAPELIQREMTRLFDRHALYDSHTMLAAFQAYLIYSMILFFQTGSAGLQDHITNLEQLASVSLTQGATVTTESTWDTPDWELWAHAEAKRRTTYTMYLFDNLLCATDGLPMFVATELAGLPAPAPKTLWEASSYDAWQRAYAFQLTTCRAWTLQIEELWSPPPHFTAEETSERSRRVDRWLSGVDEFGTMLFAVTASTHGSG